MENGSDSVLQRKRDGYTQRSEEEIESVRTTDATNPGRSIFRASTQLQISRTTTFALFC